MDIQVSKGRLEAFSDGVIAILITILVLELDFPEINENRSYHDFKEAFREFLPQLISYAISFLVIGIYWVNHHSLFHRIKHSTHKLLWFNLNFIFWLSLIAFATALVGDNPFSPYDVLLLSFIFFMTGVSYFLLSNYAMFQDDIYVEEVPVKARKKAALFNLFGPSLYLISMILTFINLRASLILLILIPLLYFIPSTSKRKHSK